MPAFAQFLMVLAWVCAAQGLAVGIISSRKPGSDVKKIFGIFFDSMLVCIWASVLLLVYAFWRSDFSLYIVFEHVQTYLPWYYRIGALWAGHEGSIVLWLFVLTLWSVVYRLTPLPAHFKTISMTVLISIHLALLSFILLASNPFVRLLPYVPFQGQDLNPLLQDLGMMFHPPILYLGYVGFAIPYAMVLAQMITQDDNARIQKVFRQIILMAWAFLTLGITLGSFWAYYELGWGGFWFWDPVENASLLPWLVATALVHSLQVPSAMRDNSRVFLLTLWVFILSLLGTFLVRSGLLSSVHSFASDPARGFFILFILLFFVCLGHFIYFRYQKTSASHKMIATSRESFLLLNQILFVVIAAIVLLGTLYPLVIEFLGWGFISVGPQYFNQILLPIGAIAAFLMGLSVSSRLRQAIQMKPQVLMGMPALLVLLWPSELSIAAKLGVALFLWVLLHTLYDILKKSISFKRVAMHLSHMGFAVFILGIAISQTEGVEQESALSPGDEVHMAGSILRLKSLNNIAGSNFDGVQALMELQTPENDTIILKPEKRFYTFRNIAISETAIQGNLYRDWYIALGEPLEEEGAWSFRIHYKPMMRLIWLGGLMMAAGMLVATGLIQNALHSVKRLFKMLT